MRKLLLGFAALLCLPATAGATFATPVEIPAAAGEVPQALAFTNAGKGVVVTQVPAGPDGGPTQILVRFPAGTRETFTNTTLLDSAQRKDGGVDLLVRRGSDLTLRRLKANGKAYDLWSVKTTSGRAALARGANRTVVAWREGTTLRLVTRPDNGIPSKPRIAHLALPSVADLALAVDVSNRLVAAVSTKQSGLILASLTARGTVLQRQVFKKVSGLLSAVVSTHGRVGVLIEDTGIVGDGGECVADSGGRHVRVAMRERKAKRFRDVQTIESPPFGCGSTGAILRAGPKDIFALLFQGGSVDLPPLLARVSISTSGHRFTEAQTLAENARSDTAVVSSNGKVIAALLRETTDPGLTAGSLSLIRTGDPEEVVDMGPAFSPLLGLDQAGQAVLAWRTGDSLLVTTDQP
jgi:hypothetical protein